MWMTLKLFFILFAVLSALSVNAQLPEEMPIEALEWSLDGRYIAVAGGLSGCGGYEMTGAAIYVLDAQNREVITQLTGFECVVRHIAWSPDSRYIVTSGPEPQLRVWDVQTGNLLLTKSGNPLGNGQVAWSPDGRMIAHVWVNDPRFEVWDADTGQSLFIAPLTPDNVSYRAILLSWISNNLLLERGFTSLNSNTDYLRIWDITTGNVRAEIEHNGVISAVAYDAGSETIAMAIRQEEGDGVVSLWDSQFVKLRDLTAFQGGLDVLAWSADGRYVLGAVTGDDAGVNIWDVNTGETVASYPAEGVKPFGDWSPYSGRLVYTPSDYFPLGLQAAAAFTDALEIVVPAPSLDRLNAIAELCDAPRVTSLDALPDFVAQVESLPEGAIPAACRADLLAVAEALR